MSRMKIFFLINTLETGGAERVLKEITPGLLKDNDITIYTLKGSNGRDIKEFAAMHVPIVRLSGITEDWRLFYTLPSLARKFKRIMESERPDSVISFLELSNLINIRANKDAIISFRTSTGFFKGIKGMVYLRMIRKYYPKAKLIVVNSLENKQQVMDYLSVDEKKIEVIYNPAPGITVTKGSLPDESFLNATKGKTLFISTGRLNHDKDWPSLLHAFSHAVQKDSSNMLAILGDGPQRKELERLAHSLDIGDNVYFAGSKSETMPYLLKADYFIFCSRAEGFPNALIEAMAAGLPIITSDFKTGAREIIDPELDFSASIPYPYYGPNGVLLGKDSYAADFARLLADGKELAQKRAGFHKFKKENILKEWMRIIKNVRD